MSGVDWSLGQEADAKAEANSSTQVTYPWRTSLRTAFQVVAGAFVGIAAFIAGLAAFAPQFLEAVKDILPEDWYAFGLGAVGVITALSLAVARVMAIPGVNEWLTKHSMGATPKHRKN